MFRIVFFFFFCFKSQFLGLKIFLLSSIPELMSEQQKFKKATQKKQPEDEVLKGLRIKTSILQRTLKDLEFAKKEVINEEERLKKIESSDKDRVPQQVNVLNEAKAMIPDAENRIRTAVADLTEYIKNNSEGTLDEEMLATARTALEQAEKTSQ